MSWYEIAVETHYEVRCCSCPWDEMAHSAGLAEEMARDHIEHINNLGGCDNLNHTVAIRALTMVGRQL